MTHVVRTRILTFLLAVLPAGIVFSLLLLFPLFGLSQTPSFSTHSFSSAAGNTVTLHGDLNNDGYEDLIIGTRVFLSKGNGTYSEVSATLSASPQLLGDFNGDGKLDLIAGNHMYLGHGDGTFHSAGAISLLAGSIATAAADVNHDGKLDLLLLTTPEGDEGNNELQVLFGNGAGSFTAGPEIMIDNSEDGCCVFPQLLTGDFNGDGNVDAAFASGWGAPSGYYGTRLRVFSGDGDGNFTLTSNDQDDDILNLSAADVNGDGISDLVGTAVNFDDDTNNILPWLDVYYGQSNGGMTSARIPLEQYGVGQLAVADFNGDGIPDIAVFETDCGSVLDGCTLTSAATIHVISGPTNGGPGFDLTASKLESSPGSLLALRGNRDTKADLVYGNTPSNSTTFFTLLNTTTGNFPTCAAPNTAVGIAQCSPTAGSTVTSPVNFAVGAASDVPLRKIDVWVDRKKLVEQFAGSFFSNYGFLNASLALAAGSHRVSVIAYGWDNSQVSKTTTITVKATPSCSAPTSAGVHICSPASGASVSSPVLVTATSKVTGTIASTQLWVDGVKNFNAPGSTTLTTSVTLAAGSHRFAVIATNTAGQKWESTVNATVK